MSESLGTRLLRMLMSLLFAFLPALLSYGLMLYGRAFADPLAFVGSFALLGALTPPTVIRASSTSAAATCAAFFIWTCMFMETQPLTIYGNLFHAHITLAFFALLSVLLCAASIALPKRRLIWSQPIIAGAVMMFNSQIGERAMLIAGLAVAVAFIARLYLRHLAETPPVPA